MHQNVHISEISLAVKGTHCGDKTRRCLEQAICNAARYICLPATPGKAQSLRAHFARSRMLTLRALKYPKKTFANVRAFFSRNGQPRQATGSSGQTIETTTQAELRAKQAKESSRQSHESARQTIDDGILQRLVTASALLGRALRNTDANMIYGFGDAMYGPERWSLASEAVDALEPVLAEPQPGLPSEPIAYFARELQIQRHEGVREARVAMGVDRAIEMLGEAAKLMWRLEEAEKAKGLENLRDIVVGGEHAVGLVAPK